MSQDNIDAASLFKIYQNYMKAHTDLAEKIAIEYKKPKKDRIKQKILDKRQDEAAQILKGAADAYNLYIAKAVTEIEGSVATINKGIEDAADIIKKLKIADQTIKVISKLIEIAMVIGASAGNWTNLGKLPDLVKDLAELVKEVKEAEPV
jgi:hypothetical protein